MKKLSVAILLAVFTLTANVSFAAERVNASSKQTMTKEEAQAIISQAYATGAIDRETAEKLYQEAATPIGLARDFITFITWLAKTAVSEGWTLTWNTVQCVYNTAYDSTAFAACQAVALTKGADAANACWANIWSESTKNTCVK